MDEELAAELARMAVEDQRIRRPSKGRACTMVRRLDPKTAMDYRRIDAENANRLGRSCPTVAGPASHSLESRALTTPG